MASVADAPLSTAATTFGAAVLSNAETATARAPGHRENRCSRVFRLQSTFEGEDPCTLSLTAREERLQQVLADAGDDAHFRFVEHFETSGEAVALVSPDLRAEAQGLDVGVAT
jgi:hypothetical protein